MRFKRPGVRYAETPQPETPYQRAAQVWDERLGTARVQARNWRLACFGALTLAGAMSAGLLWQASQSSITPYVVEVTRQGAAQLQAVFEHAVATGRLSMEKLFDENYVLVPGSNPPQYRTGFSSFTDDVAPAVQEPILAEHDVVEGCCLHD